MLSSTTNAVILALFNCRLKFIVVIPCFESFNVSKFIMVSKRIIYREWQNEN